MKIHILGGSGSGKSYISKVLGKELNIRTYDLDNVQWDNDSKKYGTKNAPEKREELLKEIVNKKDWIIEGVYYKWTDISFDNADHIYAIFPSKSLQTYRIIRRFIKRKLGIEKNDKKETIKSVYDLIKWNIEYNTKDKEVIIEKLNKYGKKVHIVNKSNEILQLLKIK